MRTLIIIYLAVCGIPHATFAQRSIHRPQPFFTQQITASWSHAPDTAHVLKNKNLTYWPIFTRFDLEHFRNNQLPHKPITYRYDATRVAHGETIDALLQDCIKRLKRTNSRFSEIGEFKILKDRDFNYRHHSGVLILKCKKHPFIVKLFMENPYTFTKPYSKGIEPCFFFSMTGGSSRYLTGFTRIKNKQNIADMIDASPTWRNQVTLPRKWFWMPHDVSWMHIRGDHLRGYGSVDTIELPGTYAVISDAIETDQPAGMFTREKRQVALDLARFLDENRLDPHIDNFMIETGTHKIAIIDTEHFASMTGMQETMQFSSYKSWYLKLSRKCFKDVMLRSKQDRNRLLTDDMPETLQIGW